MKRFLWIPVILLVGAAVYWRSSRTQVSPLSVEANERHAAFIQNATEIETFRVKWRAPGEEIGGFGIQSHGATQNAAFARSMASILAPTLHLRPAQQTGHNCSSEPGVALRFRHGEQSLNLLICLECETFAVVDGGREPFQGFDFGPSGSINPARTKLYNLMRQAFPGDGEIKKLLDRKP